MANNNLIQQSSHLEQDFSSFITTPQLRKISTLEKFSDITDENKNIINNSYLLLTTPNTKNFTLKFNSLVKQFGNSQLKERVDQLEQSLQNLRNNLNLDNIDKVIWSNYGFVNSSFNPVCVVDSTHTVNFAVKRGVILVKYNDGTPDEYITDNSNIEYVITTGDIYKEDSGNGIVTLSYANTKSEGKQQIGIKYKDHLAVNNSNEIAAVEFNTIIPKYKNYFWMVDSSHLSNIVNDGQFISGSESKSVNNSTGFPMVTSKLYNAASLVKEKFGLTDNQLDMFGLYIILPKALFTLNSNGQLQVKNTNYSLRSGSFVINRIVEESTFTINQNASAVSGYDQNLLSGYTKPIVYSVLKISNSISTGQDLNIS